MPIAIDVRCSFVSPVPQVDYIFKYFKSSNRRSISTISIFINAIVPCSTAIHNVILCHRNGGNLRELWHYNVDFNQRIIPEFMSILREPLARNDRVVAILKLLQLHSKMLTLCNVNQYYLQNFNRIQNRIRATMEQRCNSDELRKNKGTCLITYVIENYRLIVIVRLIKYNNNLLNYCLYFRRFSCNSSGRSQNSASIGCIA